MSTSGPNGIAGLWPALDRALTQGQMGRVALQEAQRGQLKEQTQESALGALLRGLQSGQNGSPQMPTIAQQKLGALAFPEQAAALAQQKVFPVAPKPMTVGKDQRIVLPSQDGKSFTEALGAIPDVPDILKPGVLDAEIKKANATRGPSDVGSFITLVGPDGKTWSGGDKTPTAQTLGAQGWKKATETKPKTIADVFKERFGGEVPPGYLPEVGPDGLPTGKLTGAVGGPADIGQKGLPQAYKDAMAGYDSLEGSVNEFQKAFEGEPAQYSPDGKLLKPAVPGTGTETSGAGAGKLDSLYSQILFAVKNAEQTGALDKGSVDVIEGMLRKPTGALSVFQNNDYTKAQIKSVKDWIARNRAAKQKAFNAPNGGVAPASTVPGGWSISKVQ